MAKKVKSRTPLKNHEKFFYKPHSTNTYSYFYKLSKRNNRRSTPQPNILPTKGFTFTMNVAYSNVFDTYVGTNLNSALYWTHSVNDSIIADGYTTIDYSDWDDASFIEKNDSTTIAINNNDTIVLSNISAQNHFLEFTAIGHNKIPVTFTIYDQNTSFNNEISIYGSKLPIGKILKIIFEAACSIALAVDYYCDQKIANDVANCTAQGLCSIVSSCSARCVQCQNSN